MKTTYETLSTRYGTSAATTYTYNREEKAKPAILAIMAMRAQIKELTEQYPGGILCAAYRHHNPEPAIGQTYAYIYNWQHENELNTYVITHTDKTHIYYKDTSHPERGDFEYRCSYPMTRETWTKDAANRTYTGSTTEAAALVFFTGPTIY